MIAKGEIDWKFTDGGDCLPFALFLLGHQFQHLYTLACNWAEIGANMSERCRNLMIIKVITRLACLIRRVLLPALILWWIIRPGHCLGTDPQTCVYILRKNPLCPKKTILNCPLTLPLVGKPFLMRLSNYLPLKCGNKSCPATKCL